MNRRLLSACFCALLLALAWHTASAYRPGERKNEAKTSWMTGFSLKTGQEYYMEVSADGAVLLRTISKNSIITRRGQIKTQLAKDFFREIESSDIFSQGGRDSKLLFYKGDKLMISAYINGEIRVIDAPLNDFGEAFSYAFNEVMKEAAKLPADTELKAFLTAEPLSKTAYQEYQDKAPKETTIIESYDIQKLPPLMKAIKQPYRLIPLSGADAAKDIQSFITLHKLYGLRKLFYLPSTRGTFKCRVLDATR